MEQFDLLFVGMTFKNTRTETSEKVVPFCLLRKMTNGSGNLDRKMSIFLHDLKS